MKSGFNMLPTGPLFPLRPRPVGFRWFRPMIVADPETRRACESRPPRVSQRLQRVAERSSRRFSPVAVFSSRCRPILLLLCLGVALGAGCAVGPNYARPDVPAPAGWKESALAHSAARGAAAAPAAGGGTMLPAAWWRIFPDPDLDALEAAAVEANQDIRRAAARVSEGRALARVAEAQRYPDIAAAGGYTRSRLSENRANRPGQNLESDDFSGSFDLSYEVDLWGRMRRSVEAARADAGAIATDLQVILLTLTADVARQYFLLRSLDAEGVVLDATIALRRDAVRLQETRNQAGLINEMDVTRARTELAGVEAERHAVARSRAGAEHALAVLCGRPPAGFAVPAKPGDITPPEIPPGLPSSLLERRPDLVEAEQLLQAASARIGVAKAAFFPTLTLTQTAGLASADLGTFIQGPSRFWSVGPSLHVPVFEGGRNEANLKAAQARYEQSLAAYRGAVLSAFREVEDALSDLTTLTAQGDAVNRERLSSRDTATLAEERYQRGLSSYLDVVDAQRAALQAERQETQLRGQRAVATILLAKALGGGWVATGPQP